MSRADTCTLLSVDRYAKIMGINPVHFSGAAGTDLFPLQGSCSDVWWQHGYIGADRVSREDIAFAISNAEQDIAEFLGYYPGPTWVSKEVQMFPRHHRPDIFDLGFNVRGDPKSLKLTWGKLLSPGRRRTDLIGPASIGGGTMVWSDPDGDGFSERMTITLPTLLTQASRQQVKVYQWSHDPDCEWEIRDPRSIRITGGNVIIEFDFWQMIDPVQQDPYPHVGGPSALDITDATIYITRCNVLREYTDYSQSSVELFWEPRFLSNCPECGGTGCVACQIHIQCGCFHPRDVELGIVVPAAGEYDSSTGVWSASAWDRCLPPDQVMLWYYAGETSPQYRAGKDLDPLSRWYAECIAWMATARLERNFCNCGALTALAQDLRMDMARSDRNGPTWLLTERMDENPFGTRKGEIMAWRRLSKLGAPIPKVAVV